MQHSNNHKIDGGFITISNGTGKGTGLSDVVSASDLVWKDDSVSREEYDKLLKKVEKLEKRIDKLTICKEVEKL